MQDRDALVGNVMRLALFRHYKDGAPVSRADLNGVVYAAYPGKRNLAQAVVALAQVRFLSSLGLHLKELDKVKRVDAGDIKKKVAAALDESKAAKGFVLRSALPHRLRAGYVDPPGDGPLRGLTMTVLALVHLASEGGLAEEKLAGHLAQLGVNVAPGQRHPVLGDVAAFMASLVKRRYLQRAKTSTAAGERWVLTMAENGLDEVGSRLDPWIASLSNHALGGGADDEDE